MLAAQTGTGYAPLTNLRRSLARRLLKLFVALVLFANSSYVYAQRSGEATSREPQLVARFSNQASAVDGSLRNSSSDSIGQFVPATVVRCKHPKRCFARRLRIR